MTGRHWSALRKATWDMGSGLGGVSGLGFQLAQQLSICFELHSSKRAEPQSQVKVSIYLPMVLCSPGFRRGVEKTGLLCVFIDASKILSASLMGLLGESLFLLTGHHSILGPTASLARPDQGLWSSLPFSLHSQLRPIEREIAHSVF